ncbi:3-oxoacyl-[acyl-carrier-protein] reductase [Micromonospora sp. NPDC047730]|uniref:3-oxoacyl-[acyl-carrier-protein] reductase n=1 Tax=Micromonospora sp. NPDC047730 TaxID=3364253 RepID=UPI003714844D
MSEIRRPVALVSGGSRGIGRAVVRQLAADGYDVAFCYQSSQQAAEKVVAEVGEAGARVLARQVDVADPQQVRDFVSGVERELGEVDAVVTVAGIIRDRPVAMMADDDWRSVIDVNLGGVYHVCRAAIRRMMRRRSGSIVTVSSVAGITGSPGQTNYSASKAGIIGFTKALAKEVGPYGIRVNTVAPGFIETDMLSNLPTWLTEGIQKRAALGRLGQVEEIAPVVTFLLSERASYLTGQVVTVDGGLTF